MHAELAGAGQRIPCGQAGYSRREQQQQATQASSPERGEGGIRVHVRECSVCSEFSE
jgi:hypothetical protein